MKVLLDGDVLVYRVAFATQKTRHMCWIGTEEDIEDRYRSDVPNLSVRGREEFNRQYETLNIADHEMVMFSSVVEPEPLDIAIATLSANIDYIALRTNASDMEVFLTGDTNFRLDIDPNYKVKRKRDKPVNYWGLRQHMIDNGAQVSEGYEADDAMGIAASNSSEEYCIATIDKDLDQIPGLHYNFVKDEFYVVSEEEAERYFWVQALSGDPGDDVQGCPGVGEATARKILKDAKTGKECWQRIVKEYERKKDHKKLSGKDPQCAAEETARLVYILRNPEQVKTWSIKAIS
jgi:hypothetical protein